MTTAKRNTRSFQFHNRSIARRCEWKPWPVKIHCSQLTRWPRFSRSHSLGCTGIRVKGLATGFPVFDAGNIGALRKQMSLPGWPPGAIPNNPANCRWFARPRTTRWQKGTQRQPNLRVVFPQPCELRYIQLRHGEPQEERNQEWLVVINLVVVSNEGNEKKSGLVAGEKTTGIRTGKPTGFNIPGGVGLVQSSPANM